MAEKSLGTPSRTGFVMGEVINRKDDPTQTGQCKVKWNTGSINQSDMSEKDLPWSKSMQSSHSASMKGVGRAATGYMEGSKVYGFSMSGDGQDMHIMGSVYSGGKGDIDGQPEYDSDIPQPAKEENNGEGGGQQPKYGDKNGVAEKYKDKSVTEYAEENGAERGKMKFPEPKESAGCVGGSEGPDGQATCQLIEA